MGIKKVSGHFKQAINANFLIYLIGACMIIYIAIRAIFTSVLEDEIITSDLYIFTGLFFPWNSYVDANNHILNSILSWIFTGFFSKSLFALRLANVLSFVLYTISVIGISKSLTGSFKRLIFVSSMLMAAGFIEFFGYCRGYGLSMGLIVSSVWMVFEYMRNRKQVLIILAILLNVLSITANLNLLPSFLIVAGFIAVLWFRKLRSEGFKSSDWFVILSWFFTIAIFIVLLKHSFSLLAAGKLYYGSPLQSGFFESVFATNLYMLFFTGNRTLAIILAAFILIWAFAFGFVVIKNILTGWGKSGVLPEAKKHPVDHYSTLKMQDRKVLSKVSNLKASINYLLFETKPLTFMIFPALFLGSIAGIYILHYAFNIRFPEDRTSLYLYPWAIGFVFFASEYINFRISNASLLVFLLVPVDFVVSSNISYSRHWYYEHYDHSFVQIVKDSSEDKLPGNITISGYKIHQKAWSYYVRYKVNGVNLLEYVNFPDNKSDYILISDTHFKKDAAFFKDYKTLAAEEASGLMILKRNIPVNRKIFLRKILPEESITTSSEYIGFLMDTVFAMQKKSFVCDVCFKTDTLQDMKDCSIKATIWNSKHESVRDYMLRLGDLSLTTQPEYNYSLSLIRLPAEAHSMVIYLHNPGKKEITLRSTALVLWELND